ncbi:amino-acid N-acetyltransferase [Desulfovibrionales bacterium]
MNDAVIRKAQVKDVKIIHRMLLECSGNGLLLPRPHIDLYSRLRDFYVLAPADQGEIKACCALALCWEDLAEIRSLAVAEDMQGRGWGTRLVEACLSEAVTMGIYRVFTLTYKTNFFASLGFIKVSKEILPHKVWSDCIHCHKFPDCNETAMLIQM